MIERFEEVVKDLGTALGVPLHVDKHGACLLVINKTMHIQLERDLRQEHLLIATHICEVPPGKLRENSLKDALKANSHFPKNGTLAYLERKNQLVLFSYLSFVGLTGQKLAEFLASFIEKANLWRTGVETGHTATLVPTAAHKTDHVFGLKP